MLLIAGFIFLTFIIFSLLKSKSGANSLKYPAKTDCKSVDKLFADDDAGVARFESFARAGMDTTLNK